MDVTNIELLYVHHISIEKVQEAGESLNRIVESLIDLLSSDIIALNRFKSKLYEAGYFDLHKELYEPTGYFIRQSTFYQVKDEFPRIQEKELRSGVGDVRYSIILAQCEEFKQDEDIIFQILSVL